MSKTVYYEWSLFEKELVPRPGFEPGSADFPALSRGLPHVKVRNDWPNYTIEALIVLSVFLSYLFNIFRYWLFELQLLIN